jgi:putative nucleotidyltransferase with HDIG domain
MSDKTPSRPAPKKKKAPPTRKLSFASRVRTSIRDLFDQVLGADVGWSLLLVGVAIVLIGNDRCADRIEPFQAGDIAPYDITTPKEVFVIDVALTEQRRAQQRESVPDVYTHDSARAQRLAAELADLFSEGRARLAEQSQADLESQLAILQEAFDTRIPDSALRALILDRFSPQLEDMIVDAVDRSMRGLVVGNRSLVERMPSITLVRIPNAREEVIQDFSAIVDVAVAREQLRSELIDSFKFNVASETSLAEFAASFVDANTVFDSLETSARKEQAAEALPPVTVSLPKGHILAKKDQRLSQPAIERISAAREASSGIFGWQGWAALLLVLSLLAFFLHRYGRYHQRNYRKLQHLHALLVLMLTSTMLLTWAIQWLSKEIVDNLSAPFNQLDVYTYLIPLGAGAIIVALLSNGRIATVYTAFASLLFGAMNGNDFYVTTWAILVQLSGVYAISSYRARAALLRAGLVVGGAGAILAVAVDVLRGGSTPLAELIYIAVLAFVGGAVGVGLLISFLLPLLESLFHVLTDVRLLELSNLENPLLQQLAVKAPGSYNHSLVVGTLAEEGARSIGANSLFCRVAAVYHDIGKVNHPEYYVENQRGVNPHDRLAPSMSALIIASHVKDGIKLAREAGLPEQIIDIIPQHHGTKLMSYFYEKAKSSTDPSLGPIKEEDFRYPGPKPQSREGAIFMLADAIEAASRTIDEPTSNRLREMIRKITNSVVLDGQLDECDLTFADLDNIQQAFHRLLVSMYHHRVDYPGFDFGNKPKQVDSDEAVSSSPS